MRPDVNVKEVDLYSAFIEVPYTQGAITVTTDVGPVLLVNVYMPTDYGDLDCYAEYVEMCAKISTLYSDSDAVFLIVIGDFNCSQTSRFCTIFEQFLSDNGLICSDMRRLSQALTYCRDDGLNMTWIDHVLSLCSKLLDENFVLISLCITIMCAQTISR